LTNFDVITCGPKSAGDAHRDMQYESTVTLFFSV